MNEFQIDVSPRKQQLKDEYERLQQEYSELVAKRDDLLQHEGPLLEALYMTTIGQLLYEELCLQQDIALLKYERDLLQAYENRGEEPDFEEILEKVEETAKTFNEKLKKEEEKRKKAKAFVEEHQEEQSKQKEADRIELKAIYKRLVHRLHPDLHPEQTEWERELFLKVQEAYEKQDLNTLRQLEEELNSGMSSEEMDNETVEEWEERIQKLKDLISAIKEEITRIENGFPFTYRTNLYDQEWVSATQEEIRVRIELLQKEKERLEKIIEYIKMQNHG